MALKAIRSFGDTLLNLNNEEDELFKTNHIFEPEFHQDKYVLPCTEIASLRGAFQIAASSKLVRPPQRGTQPDYADDENDVSTLSWEGMVSDDGSILDSGGGERNVCAIKSVCVRFGYLDFSTARCVTREFYGKRKNKAGIEKNDVLINSTGDGTIGRVAVFNYDFPAVVDGHVTILRFDDPDIAWYVAAFLLSEDGQNQLYRYINGSSGQVEIYPQDIGRIWIKPNKGSKIKSVAASYKQACEKRDEFYRDLKVALNNL